MGEGVDIGQRVVDSGLAGGGEQVQDRVGGAAHGDVEGHGVLETGKPTFEHHRLAPADLKDLHLVIYTPADDDTPQRLAQLQDKLSDAAAEAP